MYFIVKVYQFTNILIAVEKDFVILSVQHSFLILELK